MQRAHNFIDLTGQTFNRLTAIRFIDGHKFTVWLWQCICGNQVVRRADSVKHGRTTSCGCVLREIRHGMAVHGQVRPEHRAWRGAMDRCCNPRNSQYKDYGGRGITICELLRSFRSFYDLVGDRPTPKHSIDRIDNEGNYSCGECKQCIANRWPMNIRWATRAQQRRNTRQTRMLTYDGLTMCMKDWSVRVGLSPMVISYRLDKQGASIERALTAPLRSRLAT